MGDIVQGMSLGSVGDVNALDREAQDGPRELPPTCSSLRRRTAAAVYLIAAIIVLADQAAKLAVVRWLQPLETVRLTSWLSLTWATNTGGAFGVLATNTVQLIVVAVVVVTGLVLVAPRLGTSRLLMFAMAAVMGGAIGNLIDRVRVGYVIDYLDLHFWPVFNIADIAITVGAGLLIIATILGQPQCACCREDSD
mgnify:CR=1 FL=1